MARGAAFAVVAVFDAPSAFATFFVATFFITVVVVTAVVVTVVVVFAGPGFCAGEGSEAVIRVAAKYLYVASPIGYRTHLGNDHRPTKTHRM